MSASSASSSDANKADRYQAQARRVVNQYDWDYKTALTRFKPFSCLDDEDLAELFSRLELVQFEAGTSILEQGQNCQCICFVVAGHLSIGVDGQTLGEISSCDHFGAESMHALIRRFQRGGSEERLFAGSPAAATVMADSFCECLALRTKQVGRDILAKIASDKARAVGEHRGYDKNEDAGAGDEKLDELKAQRDELLLKAKTAKLLAMRDELAEQLRQHEAKSSPPPPDPAPAMNIMPRSTSDQNIAGRRHSLEPEHSGSDDEVEAEVSRTELMLAKAKLKEQLAQLLEQEQEKGKGKQEIKSTLHPFLRGVIPIPMQGSNEDLHGDRKKWGAVWENSYYFCNEVYKTNVPKAGIPVDTNGNGIVDSLAVDFTGDGRVDTIVKDEHSERVALRRNNSLTRRS